MEDGTKALDALRESKMGERQPDLYNSHLSRWNDFILREKNFRNELQKVPLELDNYHKMLHNHYILFRSPFPI